MIRSKSIASVLGTAALIVALSSCADDSGGNADDPGAGSTQEETDQTPDETPAETPEETPDETGGENPAETPAGDGETTDDGGSADEQTQGGGASGDYCDLIIDAETRFGPIAMEDVSDSDAQAMADALAGIRDAAPSDLTDDWEVMYQLMQAAADETDPSALDPSVMDNYESASTNVETSIAQDCGITE